MTNEKKNFRRIPFIWSEYKKFKGADLNVLIKDVNGNSKGVDLTGVVKVVDGNSSGVDLTLLGKIVGEESRGFDITGIIKYTMEKSKGVNLTGGFNYSKGVEDFLIQYGTFGNYVKEKNEDAFILNLGLWNRIGEDYFCPLVQVYGIKNIPKLVKKAFSKKEEGKK